MRAKLVVICGGMEVWVAARLGLAVVRVMGYNTRVGGSGYLARMADARHN